MDAMPGLSPAKNVADSPEQLLDVFKAAAFSVTKLYKTSAEAQTKARAEGYQECLDDLLVFLDKENLGVSDGEGWQIRRWATERLDGRDVVMHQTTESEDEAEKSESASSPEIHRSGSIAAPATSVVRTSTSPRRDIREETRMRASSSPSIAVHNAPITSKQTHNIAVPSQEFTFSTPIAYPPESDLNIQSLDLSDSLVHENTSPLHTASTARSRNLKGVGARQRMGRVAGTKRKINLAEIFDLPSIGGNNKDLFGGGKRSRHT